MTSKKVERDNSEECSMEEGGQRKDSQENLSDVNLPAKTIDGGQRKDSQENLSDVNLPTKTIDGTSLQVTLDKDVEFASPRESPNPVFSGESSDRLAYGMEEDSRPLGMPTEETPLLDNRVGIWATYNARPHYVLDTDNRAIIDYEVSKLTTMRVFGVYVGTVFQNPILWLETLALALVFFIVFFTTSALKFKGFSDFVGKESSLRAFIAMFTTLLGFLLSFYTSLNIKRWWDMRMQGIDNIWQGCCKLTFLVSQGVTHDPVVMSSIHRYACASLMLIFMRRSDGEKDDHSVDGSPRDRTKNLKKLVQKGLLLQEEAVLLSKVRGRARPEAIWMWLGNIVWQLNSLGLCSGPPHYCALLGAVDQGRSGAASIKAYLDTPIPMPYVHLLGVMVKIHNVIVGVLMAIMSVKHQHSGHYIPLFRTMTRAWFMPFVYNAILLINNDLADPFSGDMSDFSMDTLCTRMKRDAESYVFMGSNLPTFLREGLKSKKPEMWET